MFAVCLILLLSVTWWSGAYAQAQSEDHYTISPVSDWVSPFPFDPSTTATIPEKEGIDYLLVDSQADLRDPGTIDYFRRMISRTNTIDAVEEESIININYDPTFEQVKLHEILIYRGSEVIDALARAQIQILQQEQDSAYYIYDGSLTLNIILQDLRVGDVLDTSFSIIGKNPAFGHHAEIYFSLDWSVPVAGNHIRVLANETEPLHVRSQNTELTIPEPARKDGYLEYVITREDVEGVQYEDHTPDWFLPTSNVVFSTAAGWHDTVQWASGFYAIEAEKPPELVEVATAIAAENETDSAKAAAALQWVQNQIRYLGIELGTGSFIPSSPATVLSRRFGDCKDKTVLLLALLDLLDVKAVPALVNTDSTHQLPDFSSRLKAFDHVIVALEIDQHYHWIDPTRAWQQGGLDELYQPDYGYALLLDNESAELLSMHTDRDAGSVLIEKTIEARQNPVKMQVQITRTGYHAELFRSDWRNKGPRKIQENYLDYYNGLFDGVETITSIAMEEAGNNKIISSEAYQISDYWEVDEDDPDEPYSWLYTEILGDYLTEPEGPSNRSQPFSLKHPVTVEERIQAELPFKSQLVDDSLELDTPWFRFSYSADVSADGEIVRLAYRYQSLGDHVAPGQYKEYVSAFEQMQDTFDLVVYSKTLDSTEVVDVFKFSDLLVLLLAGVGLLILFMVFMSWVAEDRYSRDSGDQFYPVSLLKFSFMTITTFGVYLVFWFWQNFRYDTYGSKNRIVVFLKTLFMGFTAGTLGTHVSRSLSDNQRPHTLAKWLVVLVALLFFAGMMLGGRLPGVLGVVVQLGYGLVLLPYLAAINRINQNQTLYKHNSRFRIRHMVLAGLFLSYVVFMVAQHLRLNTPEEFVEGDALASFQVNALLKKEVLEPGDEVQFYYTDSWIGRSMEGIGITRDSLFYYWTEADERYFEKHRVPLGDIRALAGSDMDSLEIFLSDGEHLIIPLFPGARPLLDRIRRVDAELAASIKIRDAMSYDD